MTSSPRLSIWVFYLLSFVPYIYLVCITLIAFSYENTYGHSPCCDAQPQFSTMPHAGFITGLLLVQLLIIPISFIAYLILFLNTKNKLMHSIAFILFILGVFSLYFDCNNGYTFYWLD